jgi:hypothetical protein
MISGSRFIQPPKVLLSMMGSKGDPNGKVARVDYTRPSRLEEAFEEQDPRQNDLTDDETYARRSPAEGYDHGHIDWSSAVIGTFP